MIVIQMPNLSLQLQMTRKIFIIVLLYNTNLKIK